MTNALPKQYTAAAVIALLGDMVIAVHGDRDARFSRADGLEIAGPDSITFCKLSGLQAFEKIAYSKASVILCGALDISPLSSTVIAVAEPRKAFVKSVAAFFSPARQSGIHASAAVSPYASIDPSAYIGPNAVVGRCIVGSGTEIHANVSLYDGTRVGNNVTIFAGSTIGADGFGYERTRDGRMEKFVHLGGVVVEDDVEIGSNTSVDRGTLGDTVIRKGAKIDNQVHIAHNCDIGENAVVIAQSMIGGSVKVGARAWIAPGTLVMNGISIGKDAFCGLGSVVTKSVPDGITVMGNPARALDDAKALLAAQKKLIAG